MLESLPNVCDPPPGADAPVPSSRRGACPSLDAPMATGDGLLVRLRPLDGALTMAQFGAIADAARRFGNGILEVTARGNLQVRGLRAASAPVFAQTILAMDMALSSGVAIETPPLAGIDPQALADPRPLAAVLRAAIEAHVPPLRLAPKLSLTVDGGGRFHLGGVTADIRVAAFADAVSGEIRWRLALAGTGAKAQVIGVLAESAVPAVVLDLLQALDGIGPAARGRDLDADVWRRRFTFRDRAVEVPQAAPLPAGIHRFGNTAPILGVGLSFRQIEASVLIAFLGEMEAFGAREIRLAPEHGFFLPGLDPAHIDAARARAAAYGLRTTPDDPANPIALCAGARGCASASFDTHALAREIMDDAPGLLDGSLTLHLSGCPKGCAHPAPAMLALTSAPTGYGLVVNGSASGSPVVYIAANDVNSAFRRLDTLLGTERMANETAAACLVRLGAETIGRTVRQGRE